MDYETEGGGGGGAIADFVFSVVTILNFNLDYAKNMVYSLGNGSFHSLTIEM